MSPKTQHTLLITGASSGLGLSLALAAQRAGHRVVACARDPTSASSSHPTLAPPNVHWLALDVSSASTTASVAQAVRAHDVDVVVNNAGYSALGPVEDFGEEEVQRQFEVNVYGPLRVLRGALPHLRQRGGGVLVNVSSTAGLDALPGAGLYGGSKFALEGISEALAGELAPFGIRTLLVEPGAFRTGFLSGSAPAYASSPNPAYKGTPADEVLAKLRAMAGTQKGDPEKAAARMLEAIVGEGPGAQALGGGIRLLLGPDAVGRMENKIKALSGTLEAGREVASGTDLEE